MFCIFLGVQSPSIEMCGWNIDIMYELLHLYFSIQQEEKKLAENDNESKENDKPALLVKYFNVLIISFR